MKIRTEFSLKLSLASLLLTSLILFGGCKDNNSTEPSSSAPKTEETDKVEEPKPDSDSEEKQEEKPAEKEDSADDSATTDSETKKESKKEEKPEPKDDPASEKPEDVKPTEEKPKEAPPAKEEKKEEPKKAEEPKKESAGKESKPSEPKKAEPKPAPVTTEKPEQAKKETPPPFDFDVNNLSLFWHHDENLPGPKDAKSSYEYVVNSGNKGRLVLTNKGDKPFPASGWKIYFSAGNFLDLDQEEFAKTNPTLKLTFSGISGRYHVEPNADFKPIEPGESFTINYLANRFLMLKSGRPAGFYLVGVDPDGTENVIGNIRMEYGPMKGFAPAPDPLGPQITNKMRYERYQSFPAPSEPQICVPLPKKVEMQEGDGTPFQTLGPVEYADNLKFEGEFLKSALEKWRAGEKGADSHPVSLGIDNNLPKEGYALINKADGLEIRGGSPAGVFYGVQTLNRIILRYSPEGEKKEGWGVIPLVTIQDEPELEYRGMMVDICRHFYGLKTLKRLIDQMASLKLNKLQLHLYDDEGWRIEIVTLPELTRIGSRRGHHTESADGKTQMLPLVYDDGAEGASGYLSRDDYIALLKYAKERHIEVIPEFDVPGHSRSAIVSMRDNPKYQLVDPDDKSVHISPQGFTDNILNPAMDGVYPFLEEIFRGLNEMHETAGVPLKRVHIGGDETPEQAWTLSPAVKAKGYENADPEKDKEKATAIHRQIRMDFSEKLYDIIDKVISKDVLIGCWHDNVPYIEERMANGKAYMTDWDINGEGGYERVRSGQPTVFSNPRFTYYDLAYENNPTERGHFWAGYTDTMKVYGYKPFALTEPALTKEERQNVLGIQAQIWTETITSVEMFESYLMPRFYAFAERVWNPDVTEEQIKANWPGFAAYIGDVVFPALDRIHYHYRVPKPGVINDGGKVKALVPFGNLEIRYTTDGSEPKMESSLYDPANPPAYDKKMKMRTFTKSGTASSVVSMDE